MQMQHLFPQPVGIYQLNRDLTAKELSFIQNQETRSNISNKTSVDNTLLRNKEMTRLRDFIETSVADYLRQTYNPKHKINLSITQSWVNYTEPGQYHHKHAHPNSFISGVFYPQAHRETDKIHFYRAGFQQIKLPPESWNIFNSDSWWFAVGTGDLVLFPSSLEHMVEPVEGNHTRISLSFNTFPVGSIGDEVSLTSLNIGEDRGTLRIS